MMNKVNYSVGYGVAAFVGGASVVSWVSDKRRAAVVCNANVVVTGSTRGVGLALARKLARDGDKVVVCGRDAAIVQEVVAKIRQESGDEGGQRVFGAACDVTEPAQVEGLASFAQEQMGNVTHWVNNAGSVSGKRRPLVDLEAEDVKAVVETNLIGSLLCTRAAIKMMEQQEPPGGHIFLMDGSGTAGNATAGYAAYGATKRSMPQLAKSLASETKKSPVGIHMMSPGMVLTDLLLAESTPQFRTFFNYLAEEPATVADYLVPRIKTVQGNGQYLKFLTIPQGLLQVVLGFVLGVRRDRYFDKDGNRIVRGEEDVFLPNGVRDPFPSN